MFRVGHGYDVHRFGEGDSIQVGGVRIAYPMGVVAHSDGDVLLHAVCDALLGASGLGDIGRHFPDDDPRYAGADSRELLREVERKVRAAGWVLANLDATIIAQAPRMLPHIQAMCTNLAGDLQVETDAVNVKATTTEGLGYLGAGEGLAAHAVVLLQHV